ncbi:MAG: hypothetical protein ACR2RL_11475, partial [Gammaproteobacteria bacterium]
IDLARASCEFPERLHPVSDMLLTHFVDGNLSVAAFLRFFSLPNSDYIELARCIVTALSG